LVAIYILNYYNSFEVEELLRDFLNN